MSLKFSSGNGSGKFRVAQADMGGWVRVFCDQMEHAPADLPMFLSQTLADWFRQRPHLRLRFVRSSPASGPSRGCRRSGRLGR